jgi:putative restriction endonuclease
MQREALYRQYIFEENLTGSRKAASYIRALELLDNIIQHTPILGLKDFWSISDPSDITKLYEYTLRHQKQEGSEFLRPDLPPSYGLKGYYSAALASYREFLVMQRHEQKLWRLYNDTKISPAELARRMEAEKVDAIETLLPDRAIDFSTQEGKEVLRETKSRVNQGCFRKMILAAYENQCCVSGLNIPQVLRASHIVGWADDKANRMNPSNGLCLSATYDAAFDRHLITFDEELCLVFSPVLREYFGNEGFKQQFAGYEGKRIRMPTRFAPDETLLEKHRERLVS